MVLVPLLGLVSRYIITVEPQRKGNDTGPTSKSTPTVPGLGISPRPSNNAAVWFQQRTFKANQVLSESKKVSYNNIPMMCAASGKPSAN